jgi:hypothetical protein
MFLSTKHTDFKKKHVLINEKVKNNVIENSYFYRIYYGDNEFTSNGIVIYYKINYEKIERYFSKSKILFKELANINFINSLIKIEDTLLDLLNIKNKKKSYLIRDQIINGYLKVINNNVPLNNNSVYVLLKISGFWETNDNYGITFRCNIVKESSISHFTISNNTHINYHDTQ